MDSSSQFSKLWALAESSPVIHSTAGTHRGGWSNVCRPRPGQILKYQQGYLRVNRNQRGQRVPTLLREYSIMRRLYEAGFTNLPRPLAMATDGDQRAALLMSELEGRATLGEIANRLLVKGAPGISGQHALARTCGETIRDLHRHGIAHCSLRSEHLLICRDSNASHGWNVALIDFEHARKTLRPYAMWRDLRRLAQDPAFRNIRTTLRLRCYLAYRGYTRLTLTDKWLWRVLALSMVSKLPLRKAATEPTTGPPQPG